MNSSVNLSTIKRRNRNLKMNFNNELFQSILNSAQNPHLKIQSITYLLITSKDSETGTPPIARQERISGQFACLKLLV